MRLIRTLLRNLRGPWIADDPNPDELARLDLMDRGDAA